MLFMMCLHKIKSFFKKNPHVEKSMPLLCSALITIFVGIICLTSVSQTSLGTFVIDLCKKLITADSLNLLITIESIVFASLLTFLGLFLQMDNDVMTFIKKDRNTFIRLLDFIKKPIFSTGIMIVSTYVLYLENDIHINHYALLIWGLLLLYSLFSTIRLISIYFKQITPHRE